MPEIGEVAHATSLLKRFLAGKVIKHVSANEDPLLYVSPLTGPELSKQLTDLRVNYVHRHGKYFWITFHDSIKVVLLHFGMTGWISVKGIKTHFIAMENGGDAKAKLRNEQLKEKGVKPTDIEITEDPDMEWPPRFTKFILEADDGTQVAFTDPRRLGRVRLLEAHNDKELMDQEPLKRQGRDFSKPDERWDFEHFKKEISRHQTPIKNILMDQSEFAGVGNWVADEILYQARIYPAAYSNTLNDDQLKALYDKVIYVCEFCVKVEGNTAALPVDWLMLHRWGKRKKSERQRVAAGYLVDHITVGGRTSSYVPELQKKGGDDDDIKSEQSDQEPDEKPKRKTRKRVKKE